ncbi:MAG: hypothetical protein QOI99_2064 [Actinomycetota bacterium]|nr:hypothetical protein [Actinomycetota bacterium]
MPDRPTGAGPPPPDREWVSFEDDDEYRTWVFDVTFLASGWSCIYRRGCQGVLTGPAPEKEQGCCSYGAHFTDQDDVDRVTAVAVTLGPEEWQFRAEGLDKGILRRSPAEPQVTRMVKEACVFLNRPGFEGGVGCALHIAAVKRGERPLDYKPDVCWQLPLRRDDREDDEGHVTSTIGEWGRSGWGEGGAEFHWWCTEAREAYAGTEPLYRAMAAELSAMVGDAVYRRLAAYLDRRLTGTVPLPHPAVR